jgi:replication initiation protein RepC
VIYVLQLYEDDAAKNGGESRIKNPGGYFRALTRMVKSGKIDLAVELLAMRRRRMA